MTHRVRARYDGRALILEEPVDLPLGEPLDITIEPAARAEQPVPILADPNRSLEEKLAFLRSLAADGVDGVGLPDEALRRENMYGDDGR